MILEGGVPALSLTLASHRNDITSCSKPRGQAQKRVLKEHVTSVDRGVKSLGEKPTKDYTFLKYPLTIYFQAAITLQVNSSSIR